MKKIIVFILCSFVLFSCDDQIDDKVERIELSSSATSNVFTLTEQKDTITITSKIFNSKEEEIQNQKEISWTLIDDENKDRTSLLTKISSNQVGITIDEINRLGDYKLTCTADDKSCVYSFTIDTTESLNNSLMWSIVPISSIETKEDLGEITSMSEYDNMGNVITSDEQKGVLGNTLSYTPNDKNFLYISLKKNMKKYFGELDVELDGENIAGDVIQVENGILISAKTQEEIKTITYKIKAGNKQSKSVDISLKPYEETKQDISKPQVGGISFSSKAGKYFSILGNNISTTYAPVENGYSLEITAKRKWIGQEDTEYKNYNVFTKESNSSQIPDEWKTDENNADECVVLTPTTNGYFVYMQYAGDYKITYSLVDENTGLSLYQDTYEISVPFYSSTLQVEKQENKNRKDELLTSVIEFETGYDLLSLTNNRQNLYSYTINGSVACPIDVYTFFTPNDKEVDLDELEFSRETFNSSATRYLKYAGEYSFVVSYHNKANGYGNLSLNQKEILYYVNNGSLKITENFVIENADDYNSKDWQNLFKETIKREIDTDGKFYTTYLWDIKTPISITNATIYLKLYKIQNEKFVEVRDTAITLSAFNSIKNCSAYENWKGEIKKLTTSSKLGIRVNNSNIEDFVVFVYVYPNVGQKYESHIIPIKVEPLIENISSSATISFTNIADAEQSEVDSRELYINNLAEHRLYYRWGNGSWNSTTNSRIKVKTTKSQTLYAYAIHTSSGTQTSTITKYVSLSYPISMSISAKKDSEQTTYNQRDYTISYTPNTSVSMDIYRGNVLVKTISSSGSFDATYKEGDVSYFQVKVKGFKSYTSSSMTITKAKPTYFLGDVDAAYHGAVTGPYCVSLGITNNWQTCQINVRGGMWHSFDARGGTTLKQRLSGTYTDYIYGRNEPGHYVYKCNSSINKTWSSGQKQTFDTWTFYYGDEIRVGSNCWSLGGYRLAVLEYTVDLKGYKTSDLYVLRYGDDRLDTNPNGCPDDHDSDRRITDRYIHNEVVF